MPIFLARRGTQGRCQRVGRELAEVRRLPQFAEDAGGADRCVLHVGSGFPLEAERFGEVEGNDRCPRVLQQEVAQRADGDLPRHLLLEVSRRLGMARAHFGQRLLFEPV